MQKYKYLPIGREFEYEGVKLVVVASLNNRAVCSNCFFSDIERDLMGVPRVSCCTHGFLCTKHTRRDNKHVVFLRSINNDE